MMQHMITADNEVARTQLGIRHIDKPDILTAQ